MTTPNFSLKEPSNLSKKGNLSDNWRQWKQNFKIYLAATGISATDPTACPLFLHVIGQYGRDIFNELGFTEPYNLEEFYNKFDEHCIPKRNLTYDRYTFFNTKQEKLSFDKFYSSLKQKSLNCDFGELTNSLIGTQIIIGLDDAALRKRLLAISDLTIDQIIEECKSTELAKQQAQKIEGTCSRKLQNPNLLAQSLQDNLQIDNTKGCPRKPKPSVITNCKFCSGSHKYGECPSKTNDSNFVLVCKHCGLTHQKRKCPAYGTNCNKCKKPNHFAKMCTV